MPRVVESAVLVDSNVLIDISSRDPVWYAWSRDRLEGFAGGRLVINPIILSEFSVRFDRYEAVEEAL